MSVLLTLLTYSLCVTLKGMKRAPYFPGLVNLCLFVQSVEHSAPIYMLEFQRLYCEFCVTIRKQVRNTLSDFAVFICIVAMTGVDFFAGVHTPKLYVPAEFKPTWEGRGWIVYPFHPDNPW